jgi:hypothetical protein
MPNQNQDNEMPEITKRLSWRVWLAAIIVVLTAIVLYLLWSMWNSKSLDEQLAAIEAARAIPDSENAATIYNKLLQDPNATSLLDNWPQFLNQASEELTFKEPWLSKDYAKLAAWIREKQPVIDRLLEASKFAQCRFPIERPLPANHAMRKWTYLLKRAANNDIGDGRIDDAIDKWRCLLQMGNHLCQQPLFDAHMVAIAIEALALRQTTAFLVQGNADEAHLSRIEAFPLHTEDNWAAVLEEITPAEKLAEESWKGQMGFIERIRYIYVYEGYRSGKNPDIGKIRSQYHELLAISRGLHVLVALRRYKNRHGRWPESLDQIESQVPAEMFVDPFGSTLAYKLADDSFTLYSKGPNELDENGKRKDGCDDCPIWIPPTQEQAPKLQNTDPNQGETTKELIK